MFFEKFIHLYVSVRPRLLTFGLFVAQNLTDFEGKGVKKGLILKGDLIPRPSGKTHRAVGRERGGASRETLLPHEFYRRYRRGGEPACTRR